MTARSITRPRGPASRGAAALVVGALFLAAALQVSVAAAQDEQPAATPELLLVDATEAPFVLVRSEEKPTEVEVSIGDDPAEVGKPVAVAESSLAMQTTIVIDNSAGSDQFLEAFIAAAVSYIDNAGPNEDLSIWTTGGVSRLRVGLNNDHERTRDIVSSIVAAAGSSMLYDSIRDASLQLGDAGAGATSVIVFAGAVDGGSAESASAGAARGAVQAAGASAFAVATSDVVAAALNTLVASTDGGGLAATDDPAEIEGYGASVSEVVNGTWMIPFESDRIADGNQMSVTVDGTTLRATYAPGSTASGRGLAPFAESGDPLIPGLGFLEGDTGRSIGLLFGAIAAGLGAYAAVLLLQKPESTLTSVLQAYNDPQANATIVEEEGSSFSRSALLQRAVDLTENLAERRGALSRLEGTLERADVPLRGGEALTAGAGIAAASAVVGLVLVGNIVGMLVFLLIGVLVPGFVIRVKAARRRKRFMRQLPDTLNLLSSTLKAGFSFMQGIEAVSQEIEEPMGGELRRIVTEAQLGRPVEDAMDASAERMDSPDFAWAVMAVKIQREVGGNLSELLLTVSETMTERERLRRDVSTLTAEGKMSAMVLGALPILLGLAMWAMNPEYINTLFTDSFGKVLLGMSIFAALAGFAWMKKIINIDI